MFSNLCDVTADDKGSQGSVVLRVVIGDVCHAAAQFNLLGRVDSPVVPIYYIYVASLIIAVQLGCNEKLILAAWICIVVVFEEKRLVAVLHLERSQRRTASDDATAYMLCASRDGQGRQCGAVAEHGRTYILHRLGNGETLQCCAAPEAALQHRIDGSRNGDAGQAGVLVKSFLAYLGDIVADYKSG